MIDFSTLQGLTIPEGVVTQIADASGRVLWSIRENVISTLILRPSADISVGHVLMPSGSTVAYLLINEEESDGKSTYITTNTPTTSDNYGPENALVATSKFKLLSSEELNKGVITAANVKGDCGSNSSAGYIYFSLEINGTVVACAPVTANKTFSETISEAIAPINEYLAINKRLPSINLIVESHAFAERNNSGKAERYTAPLSQVYVELTVESY